LAFQPSQQLTRKRESKLVRAFVQENWQLGFCLGNVVKYVARAGHKDNAHMYFDRALTSAERRTLALANKLAGMLECVHERSLGNRYVELAFKHWLTHLRETITPNETELAVVKAVLQLWEEATT
jgi:hypothetical protein